MFRSSVKLTLGPRILCQKVEWPRGVSAASNPCRPRTSGTNMRSWGESPAIILYVPRTLLMPHRPRGDASTLKARIQNATTKELKRRKNIVWKLKIKTNPLIPSSISSNCLLFTMCVYLCCAYICVFQFPCECGYGCVETLDWMRSGILFSGPPPYSRRQVLEIKPRAEVHIQPCT